MALTISPGRWGETTPKLQLHNKFSREINFACTSASHINFSNFNYTNNSSANYFTARLAITITQIIPQMINCFLPGYNYNYMKYFFANYLRNNFVGNGTFGLLSFFQRHFWSCGARGPSQNRPFFPGHLRPVILKPVSRIFEISDSKPIRGKRRKCGESPSHARKKQGFEEIPKSKNTETRKMRTRKCGKCG